MKVFKFGGASVKDADSVKNMCSIIKANNKEQLVVIVSAMGKMTNAFEGLLELIMAEKNTSLAVTKIKFFHQKILCNLDLKDDLPLERDIQVIFEKS